MLLRRLRWVLAGALVAWTLVRAFGFERGWPLVPLLAFTPYVAPLALLVTAVAVWRRWWAGAVVCGACAAFLLALLAPRAIPNRAPADAPGVRVRVLAANVAANEAAAGELIAAIRRWDVDVFSAVELPPAVVLAYERAGAGSLFPSRELQPRPGYAGTGLYSSSGEVSRSGSMLAAPSANSGIDIARPGTPGSPPIAVTTPVGWMVLTRIRCGASSLANAFIRPTTPCLLAT